MTATKSRNWVFTLMPDKDENWLIVDAPCPIAAWMDAFAGKVDYLVCQIEKAPTTGQVHLQGYIQLANHQRLTFVKKISKTAHWEQV